MSDCIFDIIDCNFIQFKNKIYFPYNGSLHMCQPNSICAKLKEVFVPELLYYSLKLISEIFTESISSAVGIH